MFTVQGFIVNCIPYTYSATYKVIKVHSSLIRYYDHTVLISRHQNKLDILSMGAIFYYNTRNNRYVAI